MHFVTTLLSVEEGGENHVDDLFRNRRSNRCRERYLALRLQVARQAQLIGATDKRQSTMVIVNL